MPLTLSDQVNIEPSSSCPNKDLKKQHPETSKSSLDENNHDFSDTDSKYDDGFPPIAFEFHSDSSTLDQSTCSSSSLSHPPSPSHPTMSSSSPPSSSAVAVTPDAKSAASSPSVSPAADEPSEHVAIQKSEHKLAEELGHHAPEPLLVENPRRFVLFPIQDSEVCTRRVCIGFTLFCSSVVTNR